MSKSLGSDQILPVSIKLNIFSALRISHANTGGRARAQKFAVQKHISSLKVDLSCGASPRRAQKHKYCKFRNDRCIIHVSIFHTLLLEERLRVVAAAAAVCAVPLKNN
jgi:hypothetical protein